jgi:inner membrane protein
VTVAALTGRLTQPGPRLVIAGAVAFLVDQTLYQLVGRPVGLQGPLDETAHLLTTLMLFWAIRRPAFDRLLIPALIASVAIDVDHIPGRLGYDWLTAGTSRPYTHSLATIVVVLMLASTWRTRRILFLGIAVGVASHLCRDLAEPSGSGIAAFWPFANTTCTIPGAVYLSGVAGLALAALLRSRQRRDIDDEQIAPLRQTAPQHASGGGPSERRRIARRARADPRPWMHS